MKLFVCLTLNPSLIFVLRSCISTVRLTVFPFTTIRDIFLLIAGAVSTEGLFLATTGSVSLVIALSVIFTLGLVSLVVFFRFFLTIFPIFSSISESESSVRTLN